jgi:membrane fusion protein, multidrug efflux system
VRYAVAILAVLLLVGALAGIKFAQISTLMDFGKKSELQGPPPEAVGKAKAEEQTWETTLDAVGSVSSGRGVSIGNEVPGLVKRIAFESGQRVRAGQVLIELDASVERADLAAARAQAKLAGLTAGRARRLVHEQAMPVAQLDQAESELAGATARVDSLRAQVAKKVVRAPFSGRLGIRGVNLGQFLNPGTPITVLETTDEVFVDFTIAQERLADVKVGMAVRVRLGTEGEVIDGTLAAIEPSLDSATRTMRLRARVPNQGDALRSGMFVTVSVILAANAKYVAVPATAIVHASYGDSVFILEAKPEDEPGTRETAAGEPVLVARQQFVKTGPRRGDFVAVVEGVAAGQEVVSAGGFKLRNGAPVFVTDAAVPTPELAPHPPNR